MVLIQTGSERSFNDMFTRTFSGVVLNNFLVRAAHENDVRVFGVEFHAVRHLHTSVGGV